jgi:hypothetical protein
MNIIRMSIVPLVRSHGQGAGVDVIRSGVLVSSLLLLSFRSVCVLIAMVCGRLRRVFMYATMGSVGGCLTLENPIPVLAGTRQGNLESIR